MKKKKPWITILIIVASVIVVTVIGLVIVKAVQKNSVRTITVEAAYREIVVGNPSKSVTTIPVSIFPTTASNQGVNVFSSNTDIATVSYENGLVYVNAVSEGVVTITVQSKARSSVVDTCQINVKDVVIEKLWFFDNSEEIAQNTLSNRMQNVSLQKDGFEHDVYFNIEPLNGNLDKLKVSYDNNVLADAFINKEKQCLTIRTKTDVIQTSTYVDVDILQGSTAGDVRSQSASLRVDLVPRQAFIRFGFTSSLDNVALTYSQQNIVYLEAPSEGNGTGDNACKAYIVPQLGYDANFSNIGATDLSHYNVYIDGKLVLKPDGASNYFVKNEEDVDVIELKKTGGAIGLFTTEAFASGSYLLSFEHIYTGATADVELIYLQTSFDTDVATSPFKMNSTTTINNNTSVALEFNYDTGVKKNLVTISPASPTGSSGSEHINEDGSMEFYDENNNHIITIYRNNKKLFVRSYNAGKVKVKFNASFSYWNGIYNKYQGTASGSAATIDVDFNVRNVLTELAVTDENGSEVKQFSASENSNKTLIVQGLPIEKNVLDYSLLKVKIEKYSSNDWQTTTTNDIVINTTENQGEFAVHVNTESTYKLTFYVDSDKDNVFEAGEINKTVYIT